MMWVLENWGLEEKVVFDEVVDGLLYKEVELSSSHLKEMVFDCEINRGETLK